MVKRFRRFALWGGLAMMLVAALLFAFRPQAVIVDTAEVTHRQLLVTVGDEGKTRVHDVYQLSAPVAGRLRRIELHAGDPVVALETLVAEIEPIDPAFLDPRSEAQARTDIQAAEAGAALARAEVAEAQAELEFARREHQRAGELIGKKMISQQEFDTAERNYNTRRAAHATAVARLQMRAFELEHARAALLSPRETQAKHGKCQCVAIRSPVDGRVLRVMQQSEGVVSAATPLVEIGDPRDLEIVVDLLSSDAVQVEPGQQAMIKRWGGELVLAGQVRTVEPYGFKKVSALGIEEQRVNVIIDLTSPVDDWERLAHGYQVDVDIVLWERDAALSVPVLALFRDGENWAVFVQENGKAQPRQVTLGRKNRLLAEVVSGLLAGEQVILHPSDRITPGVRVTSR